MLDSLWSSNLTKCPFHPNVNAQFQNYSVLMYLEITIYTYASTKITKGNEKLFPEMMRQHGL